MKDLQELIEESESNGFVDAAERTEFIMGEIAKMNNPIWTELFLRAALERLLILRRTRCHTNSAGFPTGKLLPEQGLEIKKPSDSPRNNPDTGHDREGYSSRSNGRGNAARLEAYGLTHAEVKAWAVEKGLCDSTRRGAMKKEWIDRCAQEKMQASQATSPSSASA